MPEEKALVWFPLRPAKCTGNMASSHQGSNKLSLFFFFFFFFLLFWPRTKVGYARASRSTGVKYFPLGCFGVCHYLFFADLCRARKKSKTTFTGTKELWE
jgi:hypothetical protein